MCVIIDRDVDLKYKFLKVIIDLGVSSVVFINIIWILEFGNVIIFLCGGCLDFFLWKGNGN